MNKGEIISTELDKNGFKKSKIGESLGISRSTLDRRLSEINPPIEFIADISKLTGIDFFKLTNTPRPYNYINETPTKVEEDKPSYDVDYKNLYFKKVEDFDNLMEMHLKLISMMHNKEKNIATELDAMSQHYIELSNKQTSAISEGLFTIAKQLEEFRK